MKLRVLAVLSLGIIALSCSSPLSDTNVTDPSLLAPDMQVVKSMSGGARTVTYEVNIYDKNSNLVTLQNGNVKVNTYQMNVKSNIFGGEYYYLGGESEVKFQLSTKYTFAVYLSDGSEYDGSVTSQSKDLTSFTVPATQDHTQNMSVSWTDTDPAAKMYISMVYTLRTDTSTTTGVKTISIPNPSSGSFVIDKSQFAIQGGTLTSADFTLVSEIDGTVDSRFRGGSSVECLVEYTRTSQFF